MWITSMGNHGAAGGISECRRSSCSSYYLYLCYLYICIARSGAKLLSELMARHQTSMCSNHVQGIGSSAPISNAIRNHTLNEIGSWCYLWWTWALGSTTNRLNFDIRSYNDTSCLYHILLFLLCSLSYVIKLLRTYLWNCDACCLAIDANMHFFYTKTIAWICHILQQSIIFIYIYYQPEWLHHIYVIHILICYQSPKCMTKTCLHHICWFAISGIPCLSGPLKMHTHTHTERSHIPLSWNNMIAKFHWFFGGNIWLNVPRYFARSLSPFWKI